MSELNPAQIKALEIKLTNLVNCILNKALVDAEFANRLEEVLISDSLRVLLKERKKKPIKSVFNPVAFLQEHNEIELRTELEEKTDTDLRSILRSEGIRKGKELKNIERQQMINEIVQSSIRRLKQGSSFL